VGKLRSIQILRGIAACAVVVLHARYFYGGGGAFVSPTRVGAAGVDLFFVISGYIMATIAKPSAVRFLADRWWRIFPLWLLAVVPWVMLGRTNTEVLLTSFTLWPVWSEFTFPALRVGWTLSFELLFYGAIALSMRTGARVPLLAFGICLVAGAITRWPIFDYIGNPMIFEFLLGILVAKLPRDARFGAPILGVSLFCFAVAPMALFPAELAADASMSMWRVGFWGVPAALVVYGCVCLEPRLSGRGYTPLILLGDASYSIYLFHRIVQVHAPWPAVAMLGIVFGLSIHLLVERPILRAHKRVLSQNRSAFLRQLALSGRG
jgi:exopolysaccharide production protein ExoZ